MTRQLDFASVRPQRLLEWREEAYALPDGGRVATTLEVVNGEVQVSLEPVKKEVEG